MLRLKKLWCILFDHNWRFRFHYKNFSIPHRRCLRCRALQRHAGRNYWVKLHEA